MAKDKLKPEMDFKGLKTEKKHKNYAFPLFLLLVGLYFLFKDKVGFLDNEVLSKWIAILVVALGAIMFLVRMFKRA